MSITSVSRPRKYPWRRSVWPRRRCISCINPGPWADNTVPKQIYRSGRKAAPQIIEKASSFKCHYEEAVRRGNLPVQPIILHSSIKPRTGRFPRQRFAPPRNDRYFGTLRSRRKAAPFPGQAKTALREGKLLYLVL